MLIIICRNFLFLPFVGSFQNLEICGLSLLWEYVIYVFLEPAHSGFVSNAKGERAIETP